METTTTPNRTLAMVAGAAFTIGGLTILLGDALFQPSQWTTYHMLTVLTVGGTIAAGHLMRDAWSASHRLAAVGFLALFLAGTGLVVSQSVGRQAEVTDTRESTQEARNKALAEKQADLATSRQRLADADKMVDIETRTRCGKACNDWKQRAAEVRSHVKAIEAEIAALGAPALVAPKAAKMAQVAALFGFNEATAKAAFMLLEPFLWTLFFEIGSIVSLGFAFRHQPKTVSDQPKSVAAAPRRELELPEDVTHEELDELRRLLRRTGPLNNNEVADALGVVKGTASKRVSAAVAVGMVKREKIGREVAISLH